MDKCTPRVSSNGAILLGCNFVADSHASRPVRIVTHAHSDHTKMLATSSKRSLLIIAHPVTFEFLDIIGPHVPREKRVALEYGASLEFNNEKVTLLRARHIAGSAQVLVETSYGSYGYTGDFKVPGTPPMKGLDVLVVDATYGSPRLQRRWGEWDALAALIEIIDRFYSKGPIWVYGYNGKLQEVMAQLRIRGVSLDFVADEKTLLLAKIASRFYGVNLDPVHLYTGGNPDFGAVVFLHRAKMSNYLRRPGVHVELTGWELSAPARYVKESFIRVAFSDHATFKELVRYIDEARPRRVIVDATRGRDAWFTAKYVEKTLGIPSEHQPPAAGPGQDG